jgi:hypothetical protein
MGKRLSRASRASSHGDSDGDEHILDEEEQEKIIQSLERQADSKNGTYATIALLSVTSLLLVYNITSHQLFITTLSLSSLAMTACSLLHFPIARRDGPLARSARPFNGILNALIFLFKWRGKTQHWADLHIMPLCILLLSETIRHGTLQTQSSLDELRHQQYKLKSA